MSCTHTHPCSSSIPFIFSLYSQTFSHSLLSEFLSPQLVLMVLIFRLPVHCYINWFAERVTANHFRETLAPIEHHRRSWQKNEDGGGGGADRRKSSFVDGLVWSVCVCVSFLWQIFDLIYKFYTKHRVIQFDIVHCVRTDCFNNCYFW